MNLDEIINQVTHPEDVTDQFYPEDVQMNQVSGILASIPVLFWVPLLIAGQSPYAKFCANQGLTLLVLDAVFGFAGGILGGVLGIIPLIGWLLKWIVRLVCSIAVGSSFLLLLVSACQGKARKIPLVGDMIHAFM